MAKEVFQRTKPHVNVGTIGHIDHGKTTLTAAIVVRQALQEQGRRRSRPTPKSPRAAPSATTNKTVTIAVAHVEYETRQAALRPHRLPRPRRLHQEHDHRRRPDGRRHPRRRRQRRPDAADPRAHPAGPPGRRAAHRRLPEQGRHRRRPRTARTGRDGSSASCSPSTSSPATRSRSSAAARWPAMQTRRQGRRGRQVHRRPDGRPRQLHPDAGARRGQAVPDVDRRRVLDQGPRHGGHRPYRARQGARSATKSRSSA